MIMAVASPQVELLISLFFSEDDVNFSYVSYISTSGITTLHTQDIFLEKIKNHANNLIGDHIHNLCSNNYCTCPTCFLKSLEAPALWAMC